MPRLSKRDRVIHELEAAAAGKLGPDQERYQGFTKCKELHNASAILARACGRLDASARRVGAFTAATSTPLLSPPGWLPPPI